MKYRYERKYLLSRQTADILRRRVAAVMRPDSHGGAYMVHNLYLDDMYDSFYHEKVNGVFTRDKYRARYYNGNLSYIRFERKHKDGELSYKESAPLTERQYRLLLEGRVGDAADESDTPLMNMLRTLNDLRGLRPTAVFSYRREAYTYIPGNVRITFDTNIAENEYPTVGFAHRIDGVMEVKYDRFLPDVISKLLGGVPLVRTQMSKYCYAREKGQLLYVRENSRNAAEYQFN